MGFFGSLIGGASSGRNKALLLYKRGMAKAKKQDHKGAIDDYSATIESSDGPADVKAMALYNRALVYAAAKEHAKAIDDLQSLLALATTPANVRAAADEKLKKMKRRSGPGTATAP
jgi:tetratricopeptide (TPR) repeat protein